MSGETLRKLFRDFRIGPMLHGRATPQQWKEHYIALYGPSGSDSSECTPSVNKGVCVAADRSDRFSQMNYRERLRTQLADMENGLSKAAETLCGISGAARANGDERIAKHSLALSEQAWELWKAVRTPELLELVVETESLPEK